MRGPARLRRGKSATVSGPGVLPYGFVGGISRMPRRVGSSNVVRGTVSKPMACAPKVTAGVKQALVGGNFPDAYYYDSCSPSCSSGTSRQKR